MEEERRDSATIKVERMPVKLYKNDEGKEYFFLKQHTFPFQKITKLFIQYGETQAKQVQEQMEQQQTPEDGPRVIVLPSCPIECHLEGSDQASSMAANEYLTDTSFQLPNATIAAIRMRMYSEQKKEAQEQLSDAKEVVILHCDVECRLTPVAGGATSAPPALAKETPAAKEEVKVEEEEEEIAIEPLPADEPEPAAAE